MRRIRRRLTKLAFALCSLGLGTSMGAPPSVQPRSVPPADSRWKASFDAFAAADRRQAPAPGGILFVGSSSIRLWDGLERDFQGSPVLKRGFGGSRMVDVAAHVDQLVLPYKPRLIVVYAGDNDLAEGRTPQQVLDSFQQFVERVRAQLPDTRIAFLSIKPSPRRAALMPQAMQANALVASYAAAMPNLDFIDVYSRMLDGEGRPRGDLYGSDALHLNEAGYALWRSAIAPHLELPAQVLSAPGVAAAAGR
ncbi:MAG: SGNH/GDSL hydrolase family protein [Steroidobacteraceae bacterium]